MVVSTEEIGSGECPICDGLLTLARSGSGWGECAECGFAGGAEEPDDRGADDSLGVDGVLPQRTRDLPENWQSIRRQVLVRASYQCEEPGCTVRHDPPDSILEVHHDVARRHGGPDDLGNLVALCRDHHEIRTRGENESDEQRASMNTEYRPKIDMDLDGRLF